VMTFVRGVQVFSEGRILTKAGRTEFQPMGSGDRPIGE
jgi:hypothetical protein